MGVGDRSRNVSNSGPQLISQLGSLTAVEPVGSDDAIDHVSENGDRWPVLDLHSNHGFAVPPATNRAVASRGSGRTPETRSCLPISPSGLRQPPSRFCKIQ